MADTQLIIENYPTFEQGVFERLLRKRKILINQEIDENIIERVIMQIILINEQDEGIPVVERKPIEIYINSLGGMVDVGLVLCNIIRESLTPIYITTLANACSMGAIILLSGHYRKMYEFSSVLIHDGYFSISNSSKKAKQTMEYYQKLDDKIKAFIIEHTKITEEVFDKRASDEWWISADEALELGIIDEIIGR